MAYHRVGAAAWQEAGLWDGRDGRAEHLRICRQAIALLGCEWVERGARALIV
jgi:hypothetical protein